MTREAELLGGELTAYHSRENLVIGAKFLRDDLPYFAELLGEIISKTKYTRTSFSQVRPARANIFFSPRIAGRGTADYQALAKDDARQRRRIGY